MRNQKTRRNSGHARQSKQEAFMFRDAADVRKVNRTRSRESARTFVPAKVGPMAVKRYVQNMYQNGEPFVPSQDNLLYDAVMRIKHEDQAKRLAIDILPESVMALAASRFSGTNDELLEGMRTAIRGLRFKRIMGPLADAAVFGESMVGFELGDPFIPGLCLEGKRLLSQGMRSGLPVEAPHLVIAEAASAEAAQEMVAELNERAMNLTIGLENATLVTR